MTAGLPDRDPVQPDVHEYRDADGHVFYYVLKNHGAGDLVAHFSAFFGDWGDAKAYRATFQGYFHRLRMLGDVSEHNWLFLCDQYGADGNGTYYTGERGDFFVERAMLSIIDLALEECGVGPKDLVTVGSSMGATGALKFGLLLGARGVVAISPHVDLDISAARQGRERHVAFIIPDGGTQAAHNYPLTRQIRALVESWDQSRRLPRLFVQACKDDAGVFVEQVLPLCAAWRAADGQVDLDARARGGHTSDYATRPLLLDAIGRMYSDGLIHVAAYQHRRKFRGKLTRPSFHTRFYVGLRTAGSRLRAHLNRTTP